MVKPGAVVIDVGVNRIPDPEVKTAAASWAMSTLPPYNPLPAALPPIRRRRPHDHCHAAAQYRPRRRPRQWS